jgi:hypothetical protein
MARYISKLHAILLDLATAKLKSLVKTTDANLADVVVYPPTSRNPASLTDLGNFNDKELLMLSIEAELAGDNITAAALLQRRLRVLPPPKPIKSEVAAEDLWKPDGEVSTI